MPLHRTIYSDNNNFFPFKIYLQVISTMSVDYKIWEIKHWYYSDNKENFGI